MVFQERTYSVLVVSASEKFNTSTAALLPVTDFWPVVNVSSASAARRCIAERSFDLIVINAPLPDDGGLALAMDAASDLTAGVMLFVKSEVFESVLHRATGAGVAVVSKPASREMAAQTIRVLCAACQRLRGMAAKQATVEEKIREIRLVSKAKWVLIDVLKMTEAEAHRYIEKQAMDQRVSRRQVAEDVIRTYK